ncbi:MAG: DNA-protecting protein DprA [Deltaproteobacteria bacterium]|nr:DNA-protecting protein DprA [Deltaproteobacteria bacterium]
MPLTEHQRAALHLMAAHGFGPVAFGTLAPLGPPEAMLRAEPREVELRLAGNRGSSKAAEAWYQARSAFLDGNDARIAGSMALLDRGARLWIRGDEDYPAALQDLRSAPIAVMASGPRLVEALARPCIAIVGTREPTDYGVRQARAVASGLARAGVTVVSGAAHGIDETAHLAALAAGGMTVAVLGVPLGTQDDTVSTRARVTANGGCLTEMFPEHDQHAGSFPQRNRLISALARAVILVQGDHESGTRHTAEFALEQKRLLMAIPGSVEDPNSHVPHLYISRGATLVTGAADVLTALKLPVPADLAVAAPAGPPPTPEGLTEVQERMFTALARAGAPVHMDDVALAAGVAPAVASRELLELELRGLCRRSAGGAYECSR